MVKSSEVLEYLKGNLDFGNCVSVFTAGSISDELVPQSDFDVFIVIDKKKKNEFFDNLIEIMDKFVEEGKEVIYSLFRGPIKFEKEGLIHFLVFYDGKDFDENERELFRNESIMVLKSLKESGRVLYGKKVGDLIRDVDLKDSGEIGKRKKRLKEKLKLIKESGHVDYPEWKRIRGEWKLSRTKIKASKFLRDYLIGYYEKHLKNL